MNLAKMCMGCKKSLVMSNFITEERGEDKPYSKCHLCRAKLSKKKNHCKICGTKASFNFEGETTGIYCRDHKEAGMVDVKSKRCGHEGCKKITPTFNFEGETTGIYCGDHKEAGMVNVISKRCGHEGCKSQPNFNFEGETTGIYCDLHKEAGMVNVKSKRCGHEGCKKLNPVFNFEGETTGIYCRDHKEAGMVDVKNKRCGHINCRIRARYNFPNMFPAFCTRHKQDGMTPEPRKKCENCVDIAQYGILTPMHCERHKHKDEICLIERKCTNPECTNNNGIDVLDSNGHCVNFCSTLKTFEIYKKHQKKKEEFINNILQLHISLSFYFRDERGDNGCSNSKPDFVYHLGTHVLIIEVDEHQHKGYSNCGKTKEEKIKRERSRMFNHSNEYDHLPVIWIRYNPDNFRVDEKIVKVSDKERHTTLIRWVRTCINFVEAKGIMVKYLFYDGYKESDTTFDTIDEGDFSTEDFI